MNTAVLVLIGFIFFCITIVNIINLVIVSGQKEGRLSVIFSLLLIATIVFGILTLFIFIQVITKSDQENESLLSETESKTEFSIMFRVLYLSSIGLIGMAFLCLAYYKFKYEGDEKMAQWKKEFFVMSNMFLLIFGCFGFGLSKF